MTIDDRRTNRVPLEIPVEISYLDQQGVRRLERTQTKDIDRHGARIGTNCYHPPGGRINLGITHLGRSATCRVVWCNGLSNGSYEIGVELETPENVWGMHFNTTEWTAGMDPATTLWTLAQMLEEKGIISREELRARVLRGSGQVPEAIIPWAGRHV